MDEKKEFGDDDWLGWFESEMFVIVSSRNRRTDGVLRRSMCLRESACVCVCVCVRERESKEKRQVATDAILNILNPEGV